MEQPFLTIQKGIDEAYAVASHTNPVINRPVVYVLAGTYTANNILKANITIRGQGFNSTRVLGSWTLDSTFTTPPSSDSRTTLMDMVLDDINADFLALNSNEGKLYFQNCRLSGIITATAFSAINQLMVFNGEFFGTYNMTGMNSTFSSVYAQNTSTWTLNWGSVGANIFTIAGGAFVNLIINGVGGNMNVFILGNCKTNSSITLNGTGALVSLSTNSLNTTNIIYAGGATSAQVTLINDSLGLKYTPNNLINWSGTAPTSVSNALDRIATQIGPIL